MIRAYIREDFASLALSIALIRESDDGEGPRQILRLSQAPDLRGGPSLVWEPLPDAPVDLEPTVRLGDSDARALLDALGRHYQGTTDMRALRSDYEAERKRVDLLTATLGSIASNLSRAGER